MTLELPGEADYRAYYLENLTRAPLPLRTSVGNAPVYFDRHRFDHAFFESTNRDGVKNQFSLPRARHMDEIGAILASSTADRRAGWDSKRRTHDQTSCVSIAVDDFVVIVRLGLTNTGYLRGQFITCFVADNSIGKIRTAPAWNEARCVQILVRRKENGR
ncbi:hypothetical protein B5M43_003030 [Microbacterium sp. MEC084]|uniref:hypothetical protein n=1 Tax=Microbacterium sp. MEC084 TaxID=1963027 RepID=UPI00106FD119|nr:hypothetical protein [Microbacterium sp. MEC084]MCD1267821.1 hypothetical protein [Microbacterium sp. MEC084]